MKATQLIQTFKDGVLTSSKEKSLQEPVNPQTGKPQKAPEHHKVLNLGDASLLALRMATKSQESLLQEVRALRKQLLLAERATKARTRERDALKAGLHRKQNKVKSLQEHNEDLNAQLSAVLDDNAHLEEELQKYEKLMARVIQQKPNKPHPTADRGPKPGVVANVSANPAPPAESEEDHKTRAIAAKPVKK